MLQNELRALVEELRGASATMQQTVDVQAGRINTLKMTLGQLVSSLPCKSAATTVTIDSGCQ